MLLIIGRIVAKHLGYYFTGPYHIHRSFNNAHQEFGFTAEWLVDAVRAVAGCVTRDQAKFKLDQQYNYSRAPSRNLIDLSIDEDRHFSGISVRARCGVSGHPK
jgi:hypothetical protein